VGKREGKGQNTDQGSGRSTVRNKWIFVALGYVMLLAVLSFALDAGIAAMLVNYE
jgi:hypothetical protein